MNDIEDKKIYIIKDDTIFLDKILDKFTQGLNILYNNCLCHIRMDGEVIRTNKFPTILYNEDNNIYVILCSDGIIKNEDLKKVLNKKSIIYHEIIFQKPKHRTTNENWELYFCTETGTLRNYLKHLINQGLCDCNYYTNKNCTIEFGYKGKSGNMRKLFTANSDCLIEANGILLLISEKYDEHSISQIRCRGIREEIKKKELA